MALRNYLLNFEDITKTGLTLTFTIFSKIIDDSSVIAPLITELSSGFYKYSFDIESLDDDMYFVVTDGGTNILTGSLFVSNLNNIDDKTDRVLGLGHENQFIDQTVYNGNGDLTSARLRTYTNSLDVGTGVNVLNTYTIVSTFTGSTLDTFSSILTG